MKMNRKQMHGIGIEALKMHMPCTQAKELHESMCHTESSCRGKCLLNLERFWISMQIALVGGRNRSSDVYDDCDSKQVYTNG